MKKVFVSVMVLICLLFSMTMLSACGGADNSAVPENTMTEPEQNAPTYTSVELTTKNYTDYLAIVVNFDGLDVEYLGIDALGRNRYVLSCVGYVETKKTGNYQFENASILCGIVQADWQIKQVSMNVKIDYDGGGRVSFCFNKEASSSDFSLASDDFTVAVFGATGTVRVYE